jgi:hypothetical protein
MRVLPTLLVTLVGGLASSVACSRNSAEPSSNGQDGASTAKSSAPRATAPANALVTPSASVTAVVNPENLPPYTGPVGIVEGTVLVRGPESPEVPNLNVRSCPAALDTYGKMFRAGPPRADGLRPLGDAVVAITGYAGYYLPEAAEAHRVAIGANCGYRQRTIAMTYGQRLEVVNDSKVPFAPYLDGVFQPAVMMAPPERNGEAVKIYPPRPGHYHVLDQLQLFVTEDLYVLRQSLHAVTDLLGHFRIEGVPTAALKVGAQFAGIGQAQRDVEVRANVVENVEIVLTYTPSDAAPPALPPSKMPYIP